jgi:hypothetical protein
MSVVLLGDVIYLEDQCRVEDAEPLLRFLREGPTRQVDLAGAGHLHAAVFQILLAFRPPISGDRACPKFCVRGITNAEEAYYAKQSQEG